MSMGSGALAADARLPDVPQPRLSRDQIAWLTWEEMARKHTSPTPGGPCPQGCLPQMCKGDFARHHLVELKDHGGLIVEPALISDARKAEILDAGPPS